MKHMNWDRRFKEHLLDHSTLSDATIDQHLSRVRGFADWLRRNATDIGPLGHVGRVKRYGIPSAASDEHIKGYFNHLHDNHFVTGYRQQIKTSLRYYYKYLLENNIIKHAMDLVIPIRKNGVDTDRKRHVLTDQNILTLEEYFAGRVRDNIIFICLVDLGVRIHELILLGPKDFNYTLNQATIHSTKTEGTSKYGGQRIMPLSPRLAKIMMKAPATDPDESLFHITTGQIWRIIKKAGVAVGMPWLTPHLFRHRCITVFAQATGPDNVTPIFREKEISLMFGVSPETVANRYDHPSTENIVNKALKSVYSGG